MKPLDRSIDWLLESQDPGVCCLAMRDLLDYPRDDPRLKKARDLTGANQGSQGR